MKPFKSNLIRVFFSMVLMGIVALLFPQKGEAEDFFALNQIEAFHSQSLLDASDKSSDIDSLIQYYRHLRLQEENPVKPTPFLESWAKILVRIAAKGALSAAGVNSYQATSTSVPPTLKAYRQP